MSSSLQAPPERAAAARRGRRCPARRELALQRDLRTGCGGLIVAGCREGGVGELALEHRGGTIERHSDFTLRKRHAMQPVRREHFICATQCHELNCM